MTMGLKEQILANSLDREAALLEQHAAEGEARAPAYYRTNRTLYFQTVQRAETRRTDAKRLRAEAAEIRRRSST